MILVEEPSDELVLKKIYLRKHGHLPEQDGIDIIVVRGVGFGTFIAIGKDIGTRINVLRDNDGAYEENVVKARIDYADHPNVKLISSENNLEFSLEPAMIYANATDTATLNAFAKEILSAQTYSAYEKVASLEERRNFLIDWFRSADGNGKGRRKVDSAIRLFDGNLNFRYPAFLDEVFNFA